MKTHFLFCLLVSSTFPLFAQEEKAKPHSDSIAIPVYHIADLLQRINQTNDTLYIVNFWATWCSPCVKELPEFQLLQENIKDKKIKILLISLDFVDQIPSKVIPFLMKHPQKSEVIVLDEIDGNAYIDKIDKAWSGAIPATLFIKNGKKNLHEGKLNGEQLKAYCELME